MFDKKIIHYPYDILGSVAIVKFPMKMKASEKKKFGVRLLNENNSLKTVLEKVGKFSGRLRKMQTNFISGENTKDVLYRENGCIFRFNVDSTYFSPRLSNERREIASLIKNGDEVFVMFAGVSPFSICIGKNSQAKKVYSNEINREANKYGELNIQLNKLKGKVILVPGDVKRVAKKISGFRSLPLPPPTQTPAQLKSIRSSYSQKFSPTQIAFGAEIPKKFDVIVMPRPQLKDSFLKEAFLLSKKGTRIYYYDFGTEEEKKIILEKIHSEAKKAKKKIKILKIKKAGEVAPYRFRIRVDFKVL